MARTAKAPLPSETRWNRCTATCGCTDRNHPDRRFCACGVSGCERGSKERIQMREFATRVNEILTGSPMTEDGMLICPLTGEAFHISLGEVDKTLPSRGYEHGYVVMVSRIGNQERSNMQKGHRDLPGADLYAAQVRAATAADMPILPISVAVRTGDTYKGTPLRKGESNGADANNRNILAGPYGMVVKGW